MVNPILSALLKAHDYFAGLAAESGRYCETGRAVKNAIERMRDMEPIEVFGSLSKTAAASLREMADRMDRSKTAFEFSDVAGDLSALNVRLLGVSADWARAEARQEAA